MDILHLRIMTRKSVMQFGKHGDKSVQQLLDINKADYLRWVYFNSSMISFNEEILDLIGISPEFRIAKPGTNPALNNKLTLALGYLYKHKSKMSSLAKDFVKRKERMNAIKNYANSRPGKLQRYNQGHR